MNSQLQKVVPRPVGLEKSNLKGTHAGYCCYELPLLANPATYAVLLKDRNDIRGMIGPAALKKLNKTIGSFNL
jgi:hypothetical protein